MAGAVQQSRLRKAIVEMADDLHRLGIIDEVRYKKVVLLDAGKDVGATEPVTKIDIGTCGSRRG